MLKITAILILMFVGCLLASGLSCNSCGRECAPACGTRHFRSCCFNYLRKKRGPDMLQFPYENLHDLKPESKFIDDGFQMWSFTPSDALYFKDDKIDNRLHNIYM